MSVGFQIPDELNAGIDSNINLKEFKQWLGDTHFVSTYGSTFVAGTYTYMYMSWEISGIMATSSVANLLRSQLGITYDVILIFLDMVSSKF